LTSSRTAARLALLVIVFHGFLDDTYYGYGGVGALALFVPAALLARDSAPALTATRPRRSLPLAMCGAAGAVVVMVLLLPGTRALFRANLGTLLQTREELAVYEWPRWTLQDAVRRSDAISLAAATRHYHAALILDPTNAIACRRLGQIELSLGAYGAARQHLEAAFRSAPRQQATRQMLGETLALAGEVGRAASMWRTTPLEQDQLAIRRYWYSSTNDPLEPLVREAIALASED
jgi:tetratricopeptide (TPR) repeat protein